ncbi:hypothetical protein BKA62DRAFT_699782, partial [Auriculariales sp. MPI-PUGE-AT-0066]
MHRYLAVLIALALFSVAKPVVHVPGQFASGALIDDGLQSIALSKRKDDCAGVNLRARSGLDGAEVARADCTRASSPKKAPNNGLDGIYAFTSGNSPEPIKATTVLANAKVRVVSNRAPQSERNIQVTCDHILELNVLKYVLTETGACKAAMAQTTMTKWKQVDGNKIGEIDVTEGQKRILTIRDIIMRPKNLVSLQQRIEHMKTLTTDRFNGNAAPDPWASSRLDYLAMTDYTLSKTLVWSQETAALLDAEIAQQFPDNTGGVVTRWTAYLAYVETQKLLVQRLAENELREAQCTQPASHPGSSSGGKRSIQYNSSPSFWFTTARLSSLQRRTKRAPRSGAKAPAGPSCPMKKQTQKKHVLKQKAKMRPPPAKKPRKPVNRPAPRPRSPSKHTVKRPANRPRRTPGKAVPRKRITPKKQPKRVPKPTRRPKGKPRPRRR